jgi:hypothetical protein
MECGCCVDVADSRAQNWTRVGATVFNSYEIDENASVTSASTWMHLDNLDSENKGEFVSRWAVAIQYAYSFAGETYTGTYFLPETWTDGHLAAEAGKTWIGKKIVVRCNPKHPNQSCFQVMDGAPGKPHIPTAFADQPYITTLSLK